MTNTCKKTTHTPPPPPPQQINGERALKVSVILSQWIGPTIKDNPNRVSNSEACFAPLKQLKREFITKIYL